MTKSALALALGSVFTVAVATTPVYAGEAPEAPEVEEIAPAIEEAKGMSEVMPEEADEEAMPEEETKGMSEAMPEDAETEEETDEEAGGDDD